MKSMYQAKKKKREVDPNAPPRPSLLGHEKVIKDTKTVIEQQYEIIRELQMKVAKLESKMRSLQDYCSQLHQYVQRKK
jgi:predicted RNase H-like nuclease (RuvC/YqgF family)